jgi:hypothetical protein
MTTRFVYGTQLRDNKSVPALQHDSYVTSVAISPDGHHLASGGRDRKVRIWSLQRIVPASLLKSTSTTLNDAVRVYLSTTYYTLRTHGCRATASKCEFSCSTRPSHIHMYAGPRRAGFATRPNVCRLTAIFRNSTGFLTNILVTLYSLRVPLKKRQTRKMPRTTRRMESGKEDSEGVETTLQRRPSESSSLRDFPRCKSPFTVR